MTSEQNWIVKIGNMQTGIIINNALTDTGIEFFGVFRENIRRSLSKHGMSKALRSLRLGLNKKRTGNPFVELAESMR